MALLNPYCSVADLRDHLKDDGARLTTSLLERAINASSRAVDNYCGRGIDGSLGQFWQDASVTTRTYVVTDPRKVRVDDISTRTGLVVKTGSDGTTFPTTLASTEYQLEPRNADTAGASANPHAFWVIRAINSWFPRHATCLPTLQVTSRFGWSAIPAGVNEASLLKAASLFKRKDAPFGVMGVNDFGPVRISRTDPDVIELLSPFARGMYA